MSMNLCGARCAGVMIGTKKDFIKDLNKLVENGTAEKQAITLIGLSHPYLFHDIN